jgi:ribosomal protein S18 acetylase RimI-like enzyme
MANYIRIRPAKPKDILDILEIRQQTWLDTYQSRKYRVSSKDVLKMTEINSKRILRLKSQLTRKKSKTWVAEVKGRIVGFARAGKYFTKPNYVGSLYVLPAFQRKGIGVELMKKMFSWFRKGNSIALRVAVYNKKAINFYKKFGFEIRKNNISGPVLPNGRVMPCLEMFRKIL